MIVATMTVRRVGKGAQRRAHAFLLCAKDVGTPLTRLCPPYERFTERHVW
jgi:hypothetical protein